MKKITIMLATLMGTSLLQTSNVYAKKFNRIYCGKNCSASSCKKNYSFAKECIENCSPNSVENCVKEFNHLKTEFTLWGKEFLNQVRNELLTIDNAEKILSNIKTYNQAIDTQGIANEVDGWVLYDPLEIAPELLASINIYINTINNKMDTISSNNNPYIKKTIDEWVQEGWHIGKKEFFKILKLSFTALPEKTKKFFAKNDHLVLKFIHAAITE